MNRHFKRAIPYVLAYDLIPTVITEEFALALGEEADSIEDVYEPFLLRQGLVNRTPKGRQATRKAFEHLGRPLPAK